MELQTIVTKNEYECLKLNGFIMNVTMNTNDIRIHYN